MKITSAQVKNGIIIALIILLGLAGIFGSKAIKRYQKSVDALNAINNGLNQQIKLRDITIKYTEGLVKGRDAKIDSMNKAFKAKDQVIAGLTGKLNDAIAQLNGITSDSSYQFLIKIAYVFPGEMKYLFNALQIHGIHSDYLVARNAEQVIPVYQIQIATCKSEFVVRDSIELGLKKVIGLQQANITDCQKINGNKDTIIKDNEKALAKAERRKTFWKITTGGASAIAILALLGIL
jgi:hypothetical protein